jgi:hypothetical protein
MGHAHADSADKRKRWRARNADKDRAHRVVENYVRRLKRAGLAKPACSVAGCGRCDTQAHHTDYAKPLEVVWYCATHHIADVHWNGNWAHRRATVAA